MSAQDTIASEGWATERGGRDQVGIVPPLAGPEAQRRWQASVAEWDRHLASCRSCLSQGRDLCEFGEMLTDRAVMFRERWERTIRRANGRGLPPSWNRALARSVG